MTNHKLINALEALTLSNSETREETLKSLIIGVLEDENKLTQDDILKGIFQSYGFDANKIEIDQNLQDLVNEGRVIIVNGKFTLSEELLKDLADIRIKQKSREKRRKDNFKSNIEKITDFKLEEQEIDELFDGYQKYLVEIFYLNGQAAYEYFHPGLKFNGNAVEIEKQASIFLYSLFEEKAYIHLLEKYINNHNDFLLEDDISHLFDLSQRANAFLSLGLPPELHNQIYYSKLIDWVILIDTNVIYSLLDLHEHPENEACKELVALINEHKMPIKLKYLAPTFKELINKKEEWSRYIPHTEFERGHILAAIQSNSLDGVAKKYFEKMLINPKIAIHPSDVVTHAKIVLNKLRIDIYNEPFKILNEDFIKAKISEYSTYLFSINESRIEKGLQPLFKHGKQIEHDIFFREALLYLRFKNNRIVNSFNDVKYFGLTLDNLMIQYDKFELDRRENSLKFNTFFRPSFLLGRIIKLLPLPAIDYKKAFLSALTAKTFFASKKQSEKVIKALNYLCSMGIDEEDAVYELISDQLFIEKLDEIGIEEKQQFVETKINEKLKESKEDISILKESISKIQIDLVEKTDESSRLKKEVITYKNELTRVNELQQSFIHELNKLKSKSEETSYPRPAPMVQQEFNFNIPSTDQEKKENSIKKPWYNRLWFYITSTIVFLAALADVLGVGLLDIINKYKIEQTNNTGVKKSQTKVELDSLQKKLNQKMKNK